MKEKLSKIQHIVSDMDDYISTMKLCGKKAITITVSSEFIGCLIKNNNQYGIKVIENNDIEYRGIKVKSA